MIIMMIIMITIVIILAHVKPLELLRIKITCEVQLVHLLMGGGLLRHFPCAIWQPMILHSALTSCMHSRHLLVDEAENAPIPSVIITRLLLYTLFVRSNIALCISYIVPFLELSHINNLTNCVIHWNHQCNFFGTQTAMLNITF